MKGKKILVIIMAIIAVLSFSMGLGCNNSGDSSGGETVHAHQWGEWTSNGDGTHTRVCKLDGTHIETADCTGDNSKAATCLSAGYTDISCPDCGYHVHNTISPLGHMWDGDVSCENGHTCLREGCGESESSSGHNYVLVSSVKVTCTSNGVDTYKCSDCDESYQVITAYANGHDLENVKWGEPVEKTVSGCKHVFEKQGICGDCGQTVTEEDTVYQHEFTVSITQPATCQTKGIKTLTCACGETTTEEYEDANAHVWGNAENDGTYDVYHCIHQGCSASKKVLNYKEKTNATVSKSDLAESEIELKNAKVALDNDTLEALGQDVTISAETANKDLLNIDQDLKDKIGSKPVYDFSLQSDGGTVSNFEGFITIRVPYTLGEGEDPDAVAIWYINDSGEVTTIEGKYYNGEVEFMTDHFSYYTVTRLSPAERCALYGHIYKEENLKATCIKQGYSLKICTRCGEYEKVYIPALGHDLIESEREEATCIKNGKIVYKCQNCDFTTEKVLVATGHDFELVDSKDATCLEEGFYKYKCSHCEEIKTETVKTLSHKFVTEVIAPTEKSDGYTEHVCSVCGYEYKDNYIKFSEKDDPSKTAVLTTIFEKGFKDVKVVNITDFNLSLKDNVDIKLNNAEISLAISEDLTVNAYAVFDVEIVSYYKLDDIILRPKGNVKGEAFIVDDVVYVFVEGTTPTAFYNYGDSYGRNSIEAYSDSEIDYATLNLNDIYFDEDFLFTDNYHDLKQFLLGLINNNADTFKDVIGKISEKVGNSYYEVTEKLLSMLFNLDKTSEGYEVSLNAEKLLELNNYLNETKIKDIVEKYAGSGFYATLPAKIDDVLAITVKDIVDKLDEFGINIDDVEEFINSLPEELASEIDLSQVKEMLKDEEFLKTTVKDIICTAFEIEEDDFLEIYKQVIDTVTEFGEKTVYDLVEFILVSNDVDTEEFVISTLLEELINEYASGFELLIKANDAKEVQSVHLALTYSDMIDGSISVNFESDFDVESAIKPVKEMISKFDDNKVIQAIIDEYGDDIIYNPENNTIYSFERNWSYNTFLVPVTVDGQTGYIEFASTEDKYVTYHTDRVMKAIIKGCGDYYELSYNILVEENKLYLPDIPTEVLLTVVDMDYLSQYGIIGFDEQTESFVYESEFDYASRNYAYNFVTGEVIIDYYSRAETRHEYSVEIIQEAVGCEGIGIKKYTCKKCGDSYTSEYVNGHGKYTYEFELHGDNCKDGVTVKKYCGYCGKYISTEEVDYHNTFLVKTVDMSDGKVECGIDVYSCPCGYYGHYGEFGCCYSEYYGDYTIYTFYNGRKLMLKETRSPVPNETCKVRVTCEFYKDYDEQGGYSSLEIFTYTETRHTTYTYVRFAEGSTDCEDGVIISRVCSGCGFTEEYETYGHCREIVEEYDLRDYGCKCETYLRIYGCPCGKIDSYYQVEGECDFDCNTVYYHNYYDKLYVYGCAVTNPECGFRYAIKKYKNSGECNVYYDFIVNCDEYGQGGTVIKTGISENTHEYEEEYVKDGKEPCCYHIIRTCKNCGETSDGGYTYIHTYDGGKVRTEQDGCYKYYYITCDVCGREEYYDYESNHDYQTVYERTCTQFGWTECKNCHERWADDPYEHFYIWDYDKECYVCERCGLESTVGYNGEIVLEELPSNDDEIRIGYYLRYRWYNEQDYSDKFYVAVSLVSKEKPEDEPIVLSEVQVLDDEEELRNYVIIDRKEVFLVAEQYGCSLEDYLIRINFVPFGGLGSNLEFAITIE